MVGRPETNKSPEEQKYIRAALEQKVSGGTPKVLLAGAAGINPGNMTRFLKGRQALSDEAIESLYASGEVPRPTQCDLDAYREIAPAKAAPREGWEGETKSTKQAAFEKGVSPATIRKWCFQGKLNYSRTGERGHIKIWVDEKYARATSARRASRELAEARQRIRELEAELEAVRRGYEGYFALPAESDLEDLG